MLKLAIVIGVVLLVGALATAAISPGNPAEENDPLTMDELSREVGEAWQSDLRDLQRRRKLDGRITVVSVDCAKERKPLHFTCLAHAVGTGEARRLARKTRTVTGRLGRGGGYVFRYRE
jgi:hypothetical protein